MLLSIPDMTETSSRGEWDEAHEAVMTWPCLAMLITAWSQSTERRNWAQSGQRALVTCYLLQHLIQSRFYSKELETEYVLCCLLWPGLQMKPFTDPSPRISVSGQTSLLTVAGIIVTGVNLFHFVLPSQETHNLLCLSNLIIRLTLIISALLSRRGFGPR